MTSRLDTLASTADGARVQVVALELEPAESAWLSAVGISVGEVLTVLRRAPFGGPLHVASELGGEFALGAALAAGVVVASAPGPR